MLGIDIGGTYLKSGIVDARGNVSNFRKDKLPATQEQTMKQLQKLIASAPGKEVGIAIAGTVDARGNLVRVSRNMAWKKIDLAPFLSRTTGKKVTAQNDANCFVLAEHHAGAAKGYNNVCGVTLGTGLGVGMIIDGKLYAGAHNKAGEFGHAPYEAATVEDLLSSRSVEAYYQVVSGTKQKTYAIIDAGLNKEKDALYTFQMFGYNLGRALTIAATLLDPEIMVIGGGIAHAYPLFRKEMERSFKKYTSALPQKIKLKQSALMDHAGVVGAVLWARECVSTSK